MSIGLHISIRLACKGSLCVSFKRLKIQSAVLTMNVNDVSTYLDDLSRESLLCSISASRCFNNLLITTTEISRLVNRLTPFSVLKEKGNIDKSLIIDDISQNFASEYAKSGLSYQSLVLIVSGDDTGINQLQSIQSLFNFRQLENVSIIVKGSEISHIDKIYSKSFTHPKDETLKESIFPVPTGLSLQSFPNCKVYHWRDYPVLEHDFIFTSKLKNGGISNYLNNSLETISTLCDSIIDVLAGYLHHGKLLKVKSIFSKGDHSSLLVKSLINHKLPEFLSASLSLNEQSLYLEELSENTDLIVLERNLDYFPLLLTHMNYMGLLDDMFEMEYDASDNLASKDKLNDKLFHDLKHLNFGSVGMKLNDIAKDLQVELNYSERIDSVNEIKQLVKNLDSLTYKRDMVRKHTVISENILQCIKSDTASEFKHDIRETWLKLENEIFELDYKHQISEAYSLMEKCAPIEIVMSLITMISLTNDGVGQSDADNLRTAIRLNYGLKGSMILKSIFDCKLAKATVKGTDFFGNFTFTKADIETTTISTSMKDLSRKSSSKKELEFEDPSLVGVSSGQDIYKSTYTLMSKFWNLRPSEEEEKEILAVDTVAGYSQPSFSLASATVPLFARLVEALYERNFLKYKPVVNISKRPNWKNLNLDSMFKGQTIEKGLYGLPGDQKIGKTKRNSEEHIIIVLLGGITRSEISVFEHLQEKLKRKLVVITAGVVNNRSLWEAMSQI